MKTIFFPLIVALCAPLLHALDLHVEARKQIGVTTSYDGAYVVIKYPGGDVPKDTGVCTDVVIRALRGKGIDLQKDVHLDMKANFAKYPKIWGLKRPDPNIDHRRVPNLRTYFTRKGWSIPVAKKLEDNDRTKFLPGDIVTNTLPGNLPHIMIISDKKTARGIPLVIHNVGYGTQEANFLYAYPITGHYRVKK